MTAPDDTPSWEGLQPVPIRVLVKGASSAVWVSPPGGARTRQTFPWWLQAVLTSNGLPAEVRNAAREAQMITEALCDWDDEVQRWSPDVVILNYGQYECMPGILPRALERLGVGWHRHPGAVRDRIRRWIVAPTWRRLASMQRALDKALDPGPYRVKPKRFLRELERFLDQVRIVGSPLVLVMDTWPLSSRWVSWFPGMEARSAELRGCIHTWIAARGDPQVRLFPVSELLVRHDLDRALPDGVHYAAFVHREIAEELATIIAEWAQGEPHLRRSAG